MTIDLTGRNYLKELDYSPDELIYLIDLAADLKAQKAASTEQRRLDGRELALIFEKTSTRTRAAFEVAAHDQGAHVTYFGPDESQTGVKESIKDTARVLGRMFHGIEYRGFGQEAVETLGAYAGVPVWNGLTDQWHPTQMLADMLTMREQTGRPFDQIAFCYTGDARNNTARSLLVTGAMLGMDVRICAPTFLLPDADLRATALEIGRSTGARITVTPNVGTVVAGVDFLYTDVWVSMGEPDEAWDRRIAALQPYQVNASLLEAAGNADVKVMHCLPALHGTDTVLGKRLFERTGLTAFEITDDVIDSPASVVFDQAENRLHTAKAVMVATLAGPQ